MRHKRGDDSINGATFAPLLISPPTCQKIAIICARKLVVSKPVKMLLYHMRTVSDNETIRCIHSVVSQWLPPFPLNRKFTQIITLYARFCTGLLQCQCHHGTIIRTFYTTQGNLSFVDRPHKCTQIYWHINVKHYPTAFCYTTCM